VRGEAAPAFAGVRAAFEQNFAKGHEIGASCAVTLDGELVVDLWGGHRDVARRLDWERDTIVNMWSSTKMVTAKQGVLVRHVMGHTAGLPLFDEPVDDLAVFDWADCCRRLASQAPRWTPGDGSGYHAETQGWLLGELVRLVDGRSLGTFFREEVAQPLGLDLHIGVADSEFPRVADMATLRAQPHSPADKTLSNPEKPSANRSTALVNTTAWRRTEMPASNGHGNARSLALAMVALANGGRHGDHRLLSPATIERTFEVQADGIDRITQRHFKLGMGFGLNSPQTPLGSNDRSLWWAGWGGSMCVVDLENRMTVSYVMNRMLGNTDVRAASVIFAAHAARAEMA
jgi:CubicO group peptidase (beta-lactamase class C family)